MADEAHGTALCDQNEPFPQRFRTHRFARSIEARLRTLSKPNECKAWQALAEDWVLIGIGIALVLWGTKAAPWYLALFVIPAGWLLIGSRMRALATLLHEAAHRALSLSPMRNQLFGTVLSGWWVLQLHGRYVRSHVKSHHPYLGDGNRDPDTMQYIRLGLWHQNPETFLWLNVLQLLTGMKTLVNLPYLLRDRLLPERGATLTWPEIVEAAAFLGAWIALLAFLIAQGWVWEFALVWAIPYLTTFQAVNWAIEVSEHFPLVWTREQDFEKTRNRKGPALERLFTGAHGESWHRVHHLRPAIPFHNLAEAHRAMMLDPAYAAAEAETGGLFLRGPGGERSIFTVIVEEIRRARPSSP